MLGSARLVYRVLLLTAKEFGLGGGGPCVYEELRTGPMFHKGTGSILQKHRINFLAVGTGNCSPN